MIVQPTEENLEHASQVLRKGGLVVFPTETVYGLGANALDADAIKRIYEVKHRPFASPLIVHVADLAMAQSLTAEWPPLAQKLAGRFWPGPLTIVLKKALLVPDLVTSGLDSVGIRMPAHPVAQALLKVAGIPVAAPSANLFTHISPTTAQHVEEEFGTSVEIILDGGPTQVGIESTVVSLRRVPHAILRAGMISQSDLENLTGLRWERELHRPCLIEQAAESPGLHPRHYSPRTPFFLIGGDSAPPAGRGKILSLPVQPDAYARELYSALRKADNEKWDWIAVEKPPETGDWTAIWDRLKRASTPSGGD